MINHERDCRGREYICTCGYDEWVENRIEALEKLMELVLLWEETNIMWDDWATKHINTSWENSAPPSLEIWERRKIARKNLRDALAALPRPGDD